MTTKATATTSLSRSQKKNSRCIRRFSSDTRFHSFSSNLLLIVILFIQCGTLVNAAHSYRLSPSLWFRDLRDNVRSMLFSTKESTSATTTITTTAIVTSITTETTTPVNATQLSSDDLDNIIAQILANDTENVLGDNESLSSTRSDGDASPTTHYKRHRLSLKQRQMRFLDRLALLTSPLVWPLDAPLDVPSSDETPMDWDAITVQSDLTRPGRHVHIVTTAALPWFTGTAVNPLLRAAYLHRRMQALNRESTALRANNNNTVDGHSQSKDTHDLFNETNVNATAVNESTWVTLVIPWLELPEDQMQVYGKVYTQDQQEDYIRNWLRQADLQDVADSLGIVFYPARYHSGMGSVFAMGDIIQLLNPAQRDVCILEEPEHCNWYRAPSEGWTQQFQYVIGIVHTNYKEYASHEYHGLWTAPALALLSSAMVRAYCHKVIKLSDALQSYAPEKEVSSNVHGVRSCFLQEAQRRAVIGWNSTTAAAMIQSTHNVTVDDSTNTTGVSNAVQIYFVGKLLWAKGLNLLLELEDTYKDYTGQYFAIDIYGSGPDQQDIARAFLGRKHVQEQSQNVSSTFVPDEADDMEEEEGDEEDDEYSEDDEEEEDGIEVLEPGKKMQTTTIIVTQGTIKDPISGVVEEETHFRKLHRRAKKHLTKVKQSIPKSLAELRRQPIPATFPGRVDHAELVDYKVFINPSISEVLCTTTAEAMAMGKFVIIPVHPSNTFFLKFPNCLAYRNKLEAVANIRWALTHDPEPLSPAHQQALTWEAATDRLIQAAAISRREAYERERLGKSKLDERIAWLHKEIGKGATGDVLRALCGAGPASKQVQYELQRRQQQQLPPRDYDNADRDSSSDYEDNGLSAKFRRSSFAEALRRTANDVSMFFQ
jgi:digalactosyldiacylglycerol synthase